MFKSARLRLTIQYCIVFFAVFWLFSIGLYIWMEGSFGEGFVTTVKNQQIQQIGSIEVPDTSNDSVTIAGDVALQELRTRLLLVNGVMILAIPAAAWVLTKRTFVPIEQAHEKQKQFVSDSSHELRTPLTIILGEIDIALRKPRNQAEYRRVLRSTREETARLHELTEDLLAIARSDSATSMPMLDKVDCVDSITEVFHKMCLRANRKNIKLLFEPPAEPIQIYGKKELLERLLTNLIDNAIKFTAVGSVSIQLSKSSGKVNIHIEDTGVGMSRSDLSRVFERFYRADSSRTVKGFGLGLAISKTIVEQMNGTISIDSVLNKGTYVSLMFPAV